MQATAEIDNAGRLIVPKEMRDALHLVPGTRIRLDQEGEIIVLSSDEPSGRLVETHGFLVWHSATPQTTETIDVLKAIEQGREDRIKSILGDRVDL